MNKLWGFLTSGFVVLIAAISFSPVNQAAAKIKFTDNFSIYKNEPENAKPAFIGIKRLLMRMAH